MIRSSPDIGIGIATKNRWNDLEVTLTNLREQGLDRLQTVVVDDGSDQPASAEFQGKFPWVKFVRFENSEGVCPRRNHAASLLDTEFYLSLDDDSFPVAGDLAEAASWMRAHPKAAALMFQIIFTDESIPSDYAEREPILVRDFAGCGVLLRRELLLSLGGFEKRLLFYHEEPEYCFRSFQAGYDTYAYPAVVVRHVVTSINRRHAYRTRLFIRNVVLLDLWYYPHPQSVLRAFGHLPLLFIRMPSLRKNWGPFLLGSVEGFYCYFKWWRLRKRLTREQVREWEKRPASGRICMGSRPPMWK